MALVIAPTRELALQINAVLEEAGSQCGIRCGVGHRAALSFLLSAALRGCCHCNLQPAAPQDRRASPALLPAPSCRPTQPPSLPPPAPPCRSTVCVYGGVPKREQLQALRKGAAVVVATPGRLEDLMNDGACK